MVLHPLEIILIYWFGTQETFPNIIIYVYAFSRRFDPKRLTVHSGYTFLPYVFQYLSML